MILVAAGVEQTSIGQVLGITDNTLRRHYKKELLHGYASITGRLAGRLIAKADQGDMEAIKFYLERRGGWVRHDNIAVEADLNVELKLIPDERLDARLAELLGKARAAGAVGGEGTSGIPAQAVDLLP